MSFWKGFFGLFDWMFPRSMEEQLNELDNSMQDLYDRMGWGKYALPNSNCSYFSKNDIDSILEAKQQFNNAVDNYHNPIIRDPARKRINKYY